MHEIMDSSMIYRSVKRMTHEILENNKGADNLILVGIKTRGEFLALRIANFIKEIENKNVQTYSIDISYWRDDLNQNIDIPNYSLDVEDKAVIIVDDVLYKGRTTRAALDAITHYGRAKSIKLAVLIDRGHRELPIRADFVGKNIPTKSSEIVKVNLSEIDLKDSVEIL